jgi:MFS family permease
MADSEAKSNLPFEEWVPKPVGIIILVLLFIPPTFSGGAFMSNLAEMTGGMGVRTEDVQLMTYFTNIGLCLFAPFMVRFILKRRSKQTYLVCMSLLLLLNWVCATATSLPVMLAACLVTGFVRVMAMINCTFTIAPYLTGFNTIDMFTMKEDPVGEEAYKLERLRTLLMPLLYTAILIIAQASQMFTAWFAYEHEWRSAYYAVMVMLMAGMLLVVLTMADEPDKGRYEIEWQKVGEMLLMAVFLVSLTVLMVYGKTLDWMSSPLLQGSLAALLISAAVFLVVSLRKDRQHYLPLEIFGYRNVLISIVVYMSMMILFSASSFVGTFARLTTPVNSVHVGMLSGWSIIGCLIGFGLAMLMVIRKIHFRWIFATTFVIMAAGFTLLYFRFQSEGLFSSLWLPWTLLYVGLTICYGLPAAFAMKHLPSRLLATYVFIMIWIRNGIAPVVGAGVYTNWFNHEQQQCIVRLAENVDSQNLMTAAAYTQTSRIGLAKGLGTYNASQLAVMNIKSMVAKQATIVAMKDIVGTTVILLLAAGAVCLVLPYYKGERT